MLLLTTHNLDEAEILADRIAILANGQLRCWGSSLYLKTIYGVGYHLAIEKGGNTKSFDKENAAPEIDWSIPETKQELTPVGQLRGTPPLEPYDDALIEIVSGAIPEASLIKNEGKEISFQLPLNAASTFAPLLKTLDNQRNCGNISSYGINMTTLDEVFHRVARGKEGTFLASSPKHIKGPIMHTSAGVTDDSAADCCEYELDRNLHFKHMKALLRKRIIIFKRDKRAWCCTAILPSLFVLFGFFALKYAASTRDLEPLPLNIDVYNRNTITPQVPIPFNNPGSQFKCQPGWCAYPYPVTQVAVTENYTETYFFCGLQSYLLSSPSCSIDSSSNIMHRMDANANPFGVNVRGMNEVRQKVGTQY